MKTIKKMSFLVFGLFVLCVSAQSLGYTKAAVNSKGGWQGRAGIVNVKLTNDKGEPVGDLYQCYVSPRAIFDKIKPGMFIKVRNCDKKYHRCYFGERNRSRNRRGGPLRESEWLIK